MFLAVRWEGGAADPPQADRLELLAPPFSFERKGGKTIFNRKSARNYDQKQSSIHHQFSVTAMYNVRAVHPSRVAASISP